MRKSISNKIILLLLCIFLFATGIAYSDELPFQISNDSEATGTPLSITTTSLSRGMLDYEYSFQIKAEGGVPFTADTCDNPEHDPAGHYHFYMAQDRLHNGLVLDENGLIHGVPEEYGTRYQTHFGVTDAQGGSAIKKLKLSVSVNKVNFQITNNYHTYDGTLKTASIIPLRNDITETDYTVTYSGNPEGASNVGSHLIEITINKKGYAPGSLSNSHLTIIPREDASIRFARNLYSYVYTGNQFELSQDAVSVNPAEAGYEITYTGIDSTAYGPSVVPPTDIGTYRITATTKNTNYSTRSTSATLQILPPQVDLAVTDFPESVVYDANTSYSISADQISVTADSGTDSNYTGSFTATFDDISTPEVETFSEVKNVGTYQIRVALDEGTAYEVGTVTPSTLTITPQVVNFKMESEAWRDRDEIHYEKQVQSISCSPSAIGLKKADYTIYLAKEGQEPTDGSISEIGTYNVSIEIHDPNYTVGKIDPGTFELKGYRRVHFHFTNTHQEADPALLEEGQQPQVYRADYTSYYKGYVDDKTAELPFTDDTAYTVYYLPVNEKGEPDRSKACVGGVTEEGRYLIDVQINEKDENRYMIGSLDGDSGEDEASGLPIFTLKFVDSVDFSVTDGSDTQEYTGAPEGLTANVQPVSPLPEGLTYKVSYEKIVQNEENQDQLSGERSDTCIDAGKYQIHVELIKEEGSDIDLSLYRVGTITPQVFTVTPKQVDFTVTGTAIWIDKDREPASAEGDFAPRSVQVTASDEAVKDDFIVMYTLLDEAGNPTEATYEDSVVYEGSYAISIRLNNKNYEVGDLLIDGQAVAAPAFTAKTFRYIDFAVDQESLTTTAAIDVPAVYRANLTPRYFDQQDATAQLKEGTDYTVLYTPVEGHKANDPVVGGVSAPGTYAISIQLAKDNYRFRQFVDAADSSAEVLTEPVLFTLNVDCVVDFTVAEETTAVYERGITDYSVNVVPNLDEAYGLTEDDYVVTYTPVSKTSETGAVSGGAIVGSVTVPGSYRVSVDLTDATKTKGFKMGKLVNSTGAAIEAPAFTLLNPAVGFAPVKELAQPLESYVIGETLTLSGLQMGVDYAYSKGTQKVLSLSDLENNIYITAVSGTDEEPILFSTVDGTVFTEENKDQFIGRIVYVTYTVKTPVAERASAQEKDVTFQYTLGTINVSEEPILTIGFGNSPAAKILSDAGISSDASHETIDEALEGFTGTEEGHHTYEDLFYSPEAWVEISEDLVPLGMGPNPDEDPYAYLASGAFHKNAGKASALKATVQNLAQDYAAVYSDGTAVDAADVSVTLRLVNESPGRTGEEVDLTAEEELAAWKPQENSVYQLTYRFVDRREDAVLSGRTVEASRTVVVLSQLGDVNEDGNLNVADANALTKLLKESQATTAAITFDGENNSPMNAEEQPEETTGAAITAIDLNAVSTGYDLFYLYRVCDVNHDGVVDALDAAAIKKRMVIPIRPYY